MDRSVIGVIGLVVFLGIGFLISQSRKGDATAKLLLESKAFIARADIYKDHQEYFDWLVQTAHDEVAGESVSTERTGRRSRRVVVDVDKYQDDMITRMIELAKGNSRHDVAESIERLVDPDAAERQKAEKEAAKKKKKSSTSKSTSGSKEKK